jgi:PAS domain S-box-containing protein
MGKKNPMAAKKPNAQNKSRRANNKQSASQRESIALRRRRMNTIGEPRKRVFRDGANGRKVPAAKSLPKPILRQPKTELEQANQRYVDLFDFAPIGYVTFDRAGRIEEINFVAVGLLGRTRKQLIGMTFAVCVAPEDTQRFLHHLFDCRSSDGPVVTELHLKRTNGEKIPVQLSTTATFRLVKDGARLYQTAIFDLTETKRAEQALRESQQRLQVTYERAPIGITESTPDGQYVGVNPEFCRILGYTEEELLQRSIEDVTHKNDFARDKELHRQLVAGEIPFYRIEKRYVRKDGAIMWAEKLHSAVRDAKGATLYTIGAIRDITDYKKAQAALERSKQLLEKLVRQRTKALRSANAELEDEIKRRRGLESEILEISDREQQRFGQELHDGLCQQLTAISLMAQASALRLRNHRVIEVEDIEKIARLISGSVVSARNIARDLHKEKVDAATFETALSDLVNREVWKVPCRLVVWNEPNLQDDKAAAELYRIIREALINANKHARASKIVLEVRRDSDELICSVRDNGIGLNAKKNSGRGLGFEIMNYRARSIGARLQVESPRNGGTLLSVHLPEPR